MPKTKKDYGFPQVMAPGAVADALDVTSSTVNNWRKGGNFRAIVTPGGQHRYFVDEVKAVFYGELVNEDEVTETGENVVEEAENVEEDATSELDDIVDTL